MLARGNNSKPTEKKAAPANKKRMRLEDRALNRAAESALLSSWRRTLEFFILSILRVEGSRLRVDNPWGNPHDGYHEAGTLSEISGFHTALEMAGVKLETTHGQKEGDPLRHALGYTSRSYLPQILSVLAGYSDEALHRLVQAFMAALIAPVVDGMITEGHEHLLSFPADMRAFFTPDTEYLEACKKGDFEDIFAQLGKSSQGLTNKANAERVAKMPEYSTYLPKRLRDVSAAHVEPDPDEAPFEVEDKLAEAA